MKTFEVFFVALLLFFGLAGTATAGPSFEPVWEKTVADSIKDVAVSADGSTFVVLTASTVSCYTADGTLLWEVPGNHAMHVGISGDGSLVVLGGEDLRAYDDTGTRVFRHANGYFAYGVGVSPDGSCIAGGFDNESLMLFRRNATGVFLPAWAVGTDDDIVALDLAENASSIVAGEKTGMVMRYTGEGRLLWRYDTGSRELSCSIAADGSYIAAGADHGMASCINRNGNLIWTAVSGDGLPGIGIAKDKTLIVVGGEGITLRSPEGDDLGAVSDTPAHALAISGEGTMIVAAGDEKTVTLYRTGEKTPTAGTETTSATPTPNTPKKTEPPETEAAQSPLGAMLAITAFLAPMYDRKKGK